MVFRKTVGKRRLVDTHTKPKNQKDATPFDTSKTSKTQESDTSLILAKFQKNRGDTTFQLISTTQISKQKQRFEKTSNFKKSRGGDIPSIPTKNNF